MALTDDDKKWLEERFATFATMEALRDAEAKMREHTEHVETKLLRAFHGWARTMEVRVRAGGQMVSSMDERLALAEERISELERKRDSAA
jgi:hypothetical protein